ncbi:MAG: hypothetical protein VB142_08270 [Burkholderia sp.]
MREHSLQMVCEAGFLAMQFNSVAATNQVAIVLWKKMGFMAIGTLPRAYSHVRHRPGRCLVIYRWLGESDSQPETSRPPDRRVP